MQEQSFNINEITKPTLNFIVFVFCYYVGCYVFAEVSYPQDSRWNISKPVHFTLLE